MKNPIHDFGRFLGNCLFGMFVLVLVSGWSIALANEPAPAPEAKAPATPEAVYAQTILDQRNALLAQAADLSAQVAALKQALGIEQAKSAGLEKQVADLKPKVPTKADPAKAAPRGVVPGK